MAIYITTEDPNRLLEDIRKSIDNKVVETWSIDEEGDYTHISQWKNRAWFKAHVHDNQLQFGLIGRKDEVMSKMIYGLYHGRFSEMLLIHFDESIEQLQLTPKGVAGLDSF